MPPFWIHPTVFHLQRRNADILSLWASVILLWLAGTARKIRSSSWWSNCLAGKSGILFFHSYFLSTVVQDANFGEKIGVEKVGKKRKRHFLANLRHLQVLNIYKGTTHFEDNRFSLVKCYFDIFIIIIIIIKACRQYGFPKSCSPSVPIGYRSPQIQLTILSTSSELIKVNFCWSTNTSLSMYSCIVSKEELQQSWYIKI